MRQAITPRTLSKITDMIPDEWLEEEGSCLSVAEKREGYRTFLTKRLAESHIFTEEALRQRDNLSLS